MPDVRDDEKLSHAAETYPTLLSLAVHELRTPASVVGGYLRMIQRDTTTPINDRHAKMIDEAAKSCARLVEIVEEMSQVGKLDSGAIAFARQPLEIFALVREVAELVHDGRDREVHLQVRGEDHGASLSGDAPRLRAAFTAVFRAILREKPGPSTVVADCRLVTRDGLTSAIVIVSEDATVQEAYEREPGPFVWKERGGLGLALPLARRTIEGHDGRLWSPQPAAENDPLPRGSAIISLPLRS
jgi:K+-sensing histidine kinase KdpD